MKNRSIDHKTQNRFECLTAAGRALLLAGTVGMAVGVITGAAIGVFVFIIGAFFGVLYGIPIGFAAGVLGAAIGGRRGCAIGGVMAGTLGGAIAGTVVGDSGSPASLSLIAGASSGFGVLAMTVLSVCGYFAGACVDKRLALGAKATGVIRDLWIALQASRIREIPLPGRLALAVCELIPFGMLLWSAIKFLNR